MNRIHNETRAVVLSAAAAITLALATLMYAGAS